MTSERYKIVRGYRDHDDRHTIQTGLTLEQAQAWCRNPETSSSTATSRQAKRLTKLRGPWFDRYEVQQ